MAVVTIVNEDKKLTDPQEITVNLASHGIDYERWTPSHPVSDDAEPSEILDAYSREIDALKERGGYVTADVIDVSPATPGLDAMLAKFNREHWHDEDEVRFTIAGHGLFHIHTTGGAVLAIEVEAGDLIRVPKGTLLDTEHTMIHHAFPLQFVRITAYKVTVLLCTAAGN